MPTLNEFFARHHIAPTEGYSQQVPGQIAFLQKMGSLPWVKRVMEIGFNAGHSAELFLSSNPIMELVSFDIGHHDYLKHGKEFIDKIYPNRHTLIIGNSLNTVPEYSKTAKPFDLIFIDGGHDYPIAYGDIMNCKKLAHKDTIVIMDDTMKTKNWLMGWNYGPNRAWSDCIANKVIVELGSEDCQPGRGHSWGHYLF
jgi:predicted O-methyltransferase YrrM